jgi:hypothetical protein
MNGKDNTVSGYRFQVTGSRTAVLGVFPVTCNLQLVTDLLNN